MHASARWTRRGQRCRIGHLRDGCDPRDGFFRKTAERVRDGANQLAVHVYWTAAHASDDAGVRERPSFEPGQNQIPVGPDDVFEDPQDVCLEFFDMRPVEDRPADPHHAGTDVVDSHLRRRGRCERGDGAGGGTD